MTAEVAYHRLDRSNAGLLAGADVFDGPVLPDRLAAFLSDPGHALVFATTGAGVIGFASGTVLLHPDKAPAFFVNELSVAPAFRKLGVGTALLRRLIAVAGARGCTAVWVATEAGNAPARAVYRRLAGRETEGIVVYDWGGAMGPA